MKTLYANKKIGIESKCHFCFALAKVSEDLGDLEEAFYYLKEGNALRKKIIPYNIKNDQSYFGILKKIDSSGPKSAFLSIKKTVSAIPIFILGMPRSGTTLIEQIISSHSQVTAAGELRFIQQFGSEMAVDAHKLNKMNLFQLRKQYLAKIAPIADGSMFFTDKMPQNFLFIGLICRAFPEAKIIHLKRDAAATCWSNFKHYFSSRNLNYCCDLDDVVKYYRLYKELMQFWNERYSDRIYNVNYDKLTLDQASETKKLISHLCLDWQDACLSPHKNKRSVTTASNQQIRQKVYKGSSQQWRKFEPYLDGIFDELDT